MTCQRSYAKYRGGELQGLGCLFCSVCLQPAAKFISERWRWLRLISVSDATTMNLPVTEMVGNVDGYRFLFSLSALWNFLDLATNPNRLLRLQSVFWDFVANMFAGPEHVYASVRSTRIAHPSEVTSQSFQQTIAFLACASFIHSRSGVL